MHKLKNECIWFQIACVHVREIGIEKGVEYNITAKERRKALPPPPPPPQPLPSPNPFPFFPLPPQWKPNNIEWAWTDEVSKKKKEKKTTNRK